MKSLSDKKIDKKLKLYEGRKKDKNTETDQEAKQDSGQLIKKEEDDEEDEDLKFGPTFGKLYHMFGGLSVIL